MAWRMGAAKGDETGTQGQAWIESTARDIPAGEQRLPEKARQQRNERDEAHALRPGRQQCRLTQVAPAAATKPTTSAEREKPIRATQNTRNKAQRTSAVRTGELDF